ncbi:CAP domain-containing protein [Neurospora crassa]|nr:CAP domain-containing protein [Neurospora crassa]
MLHSSILAITALFLSATTSVIALPAAEADLAALEHDTADTAAHLFKRASPGPTDTTFIKNVLNTVNPIRSKYKANPLAWDATLASFALKKSNGCMLNHIGPYGENAYWWWTIPATSTPNFATTVTNAFKSWTSQAEISAYQQGDLLGGGHFTQTVWKASTQIGCAFSTNRCVQNPNQDWWFYCEFSPRGNLVGAYPGNVTVV